MTSQEYSGNKGLLWVAQVVRHDVDTTLPACNAMCHDTLMPSFYKTLLPSRFLIEDEAGQQYVDMKVGQLKHYHCHFIAEEACTENTFLPGLGSCADTFRLLSPNFSGV